MLGGPPLSNRKLAVVAAMLGCLVLSLIVVAIARGDEWTFFYPGEVLTFGCRVTSMDLYVAGSNERHDVWQATAWATRAKAVGNWEWVAGRFPLTTKGRHQAEKVCSRWQDEAERQVNKISRNSRKQQTQKEHSQ